MNEVKMWMESKKKTHWRVWESQGKYSWVLFFTEDMVTYYHGTEESEAKCLDEIKWAIGSHIKKNML